jgi:hypothetical protein
MPTSLNYASQEEPRHDPLSDTLQQFQELVGPQWLAEEFRAAYLVGKLRIYLGVQQQPVPWVPPGGKS